MLSSGVSIRISKVRIINLIYSAFNYFINSPSPSTEPPTHTAITGLRP